MKAVPGKLIDYFRAEAQELLQKLNQETLTFEKDRAPAQHTALLRYAHTLKGAARVVGQSEIASATHKFEEILTPYRDATGDFPLEKIDTLLSLLDTISRQLEHLEPPLPQEPARQESSQALNPIRVRTGEDSNLTLLSQQGLEVEALLENLRAATGQLEALKRGLHTLERSITLGELLGAYLAGDATSKSARFVADELQSHLRGTEQNLARGVEQLERELNQVRESTERLRLVRAEALFPALQRALRDAAAAHRCQAELLTIGGELRLEAPLLGAVQGALVQAVRNCAAHGIEPPEERERQGKPRHGTVTVEVSRQGRWLLLSCRDDGRGIDLEKVRRALQRQGKVPAEPSQEALLASLLQGGLSTSSSVTQTAGHGIGLGLIQEVADSLGGEALLTTSPGEFTQLSLKLPWSVAGMEFLELSTQADEGQMTRVLLPLAKVRAAFRLKLHEISKDHDGESVVFEGEGVRLLSLSTLLQQGPSEGLTATILSSSNGLVGLRVDSLGGTRIAGLLPLPPRSQAAPYIAGAVLNADGDPVLVLEPDGLFEETRRAQPMSPALPLNRPRVLVIDDSLTTRMLQQSILESAGFEVELASSAEEGLEKALETDYQLFLVDVEMPGIDGFTFVERTRADPRLQKIPAILITSRNSAEDKLRGHSVGAQGYMVKSEFDQKGLLKQIQELLS